jgi:hypothetical protein
MQTDNANIDRARAAFDKMYPPPPQIPQSMCAMDNSQITDDADPVTLDSIHWFCPAHRKMHVCKHWCPNMMVPERLCRITLMPIPEEPAEPEEISDSEILEVYRREHRIIGQLVVLADECNVHECSSWFAFYNQKRYVCTEHHGIHHCTPNGVCPVVDGRCRVSGILREQRAGKKPRTYGKRNKNKIDEVLQSTRCVFANGEWRENRARLWAEFIGKFLDIVDMSRSRDNTFAVMYACQTDGMMVRGQRVLPVVPKKAVPADVSEVFSRTLRHKRKARLNRITHAIRDILIKITQDKSGMLDKIYELNKSTFRSM